MNEALKQKCIEYARRKGVHELPSGALLGAVELGFWGIPETIAAENGVYRQGEAYFELNEESNQCIATYDIDFLRNAILFVADNGCTYYANIKILDMLKIAGYQRREFIHYVYSKS